MTKYRVLFFFLLLYGFFVTESNCQDNRYTLKQADIILSLKENIKYPRYKWYFSSGGLFSDINGSIAVNGHNSGIGTKLDFEENLGLSEFITTYRIEGTYNFNPKHSLTAAFLVLNRESETTLKDSVRFGDYLFRAANFSFLM